MRKLPPGACAANRSQPAVEREDRLRVVQGAALKEQCGMDKCAAEGRLRRQAYPDPGEMRYLLKDCCKQEEMQEHLMRKFEHQMFLRFKFQK